MEDSEKSSRVSLTSPIRCATSWLIRGSHGVDVDRNSGGTARIAEVHTSLLRVGRTHVGFVMICNRKARPLRY